MKVVVILAIFIIVCANSRSLRMRKSYDFKRTKYSAGDGRMNPCHLPKNPGTGNAHIPSYYFDYQKAMCIPFIYGGMRGNANRFSTLHECETICLME
nr:hypothetical transcript [Hymenolepis microstoma]